MLRFSLIFLLAPADAVSRYEAVLGLVCKPNNACILSQGYLNVIDHGSENVQLSSSVNMHYCTKRVDGRCPGWRGLIGCSLGWCVLIGCWLFWSVLTGGMRLLHLQQLIICAEAIYQFINISWIALNVCVVFKALHVRDLCWSLCDFLPSCLPKASRLYRFRSQC